MPLNGSCVFGVFDNDKRFPDKIIQYSNVQGDIKMLKLPVNDDKKEPGCSS